MSTDLRVIRAAVHDDDGYGHLWRDGRCIGIWGPTDLHHAHALAAWFNGGPHPDPLADPNVRHAWGFYDLRDGERGIATFSREADAYLAVIAHTEQGAA